MMGCHIGKAAPAAADHPSQRHLRHLMSQQLTTAPTAELPTPAFLRAALGPTYRVERELGGGGMSRLFVATRCDDGQPQRVVVKVLLRADATAEAVRRFRREIEVTRALRHPHVLPLLAEGG